MSLRPFDIGAARWTAEPGAVRQIDSVLSVEATQGSDFWRDPRSGTVKHDGHLLGIEHRGDIAIQCEVGGGFSGAYDQAGLMICFAETRWIKLVLDVIAGRIHVVTVMTNGWSDSAVWPIEQDRLRLRLSRIGSAVAAEIGPAGSEAFAVVRLGRLAGDGAYRIGPMCCAPTRAGFTAEFRNIVIGPPPADLEA